MPLSRRELMQTGTLLGAVAMMPRAATGHNHHLQAAGYPFEHLNPLLTGKVTVEGFETTFQPGQIGDLNTHVFSGPQTLDYTEIGLVPYLLAFANEQFRDYSLIPVFPLRMFRHRSLFVRSDSGIEHPAQLRGKRIGTPGFSSTSLTWIRGILQHEYGVSPGDVQWVLSAVDSSGDNSGQISAQEQVTPDGLDIRTGPAGKNESELLIDGDVDALMHAAEPRAFVEGDPRIRRLFTDSRAAEQAYFQDTGIYPIMHAVAVRNATIEEHPNLPVALFEAYSKAKTMAYAEAQQKWFLRSIPWFQAELESTKALMGSNFMPYGVAPNAKTLDALLQYTHEQGLAQRRVAIEELFLPSTMALLEDA